MVGLAAPANLPSGWQFRGRRRIIRGPRGYRDTIVESKLFLVSKTPQVALRQITDVNTKVSTLIARSGLSYQPLLLWVAPEQPVQLPRRIVDVIEREAAS